MSVGYLKTWIRVRIMTFPTHFSCICKIKQYCIFLLLVPPVTVWTPQPCIRKLVTLCVFGALHLQPQTFVCCFCDAGVFVNHCWHCEEGRRPFALRQRAFVDHYFGSVMSMSALWRGETELTEGGGSGFGGLSLSLLLTVTHFTAHTLLISPLSSMRPDCFPWPKRHEDLLHVFVLFRNPYVCLENILHS